VKNAIHAVKKGDRKSGVRHARNRQPLAQPVQKIDHAEGRADAFRWKVVAIFAVALSLRLAHIWHIRSSPFFETLLGDARGYDAWARQIAAGDWRGHGVFYQAPLYPYFLGVVYSFFGRDLFLVRICQAIIGAAGCALLALAGRRLYSERVGWFAGIGLAIYAPAIFFDGLLQKSVLDLFFLALVLWLFAGLVKDPAKRLRWFLSGLAVGALALTRENALLLIVPILMWRLVQPDGSVRSHARRSTILAFALGLMIVLGPVAVRNRLVGGEWHLTTSQFGTNFYLGNNPIADGTAGALREGRGTVEYEQDDASQLAQAAEGRTLTPRQVSNFWTRQALAFIRDNPRQWMTLEARKLVLLTNRTELVDTESQESYEEWSPLLRLAGRVAHFGTLLPIAVLGLIVSWSDRRKLWPLYAMAGTYAASVVFFFVSARYRLPLVPFLMLFAAVALSLLPGFVRSARRSTIATSAAAAIAVAICANWPLWPSGLMRAVTENNLGNALQRDNRLREAEVHYRRAIDIHPDYAATYVNLGEVLLAQGRPADAVEEYKRASSMSPADVNLNTRLGIALQRAGRSVDAVLAFQQAVAGGEHSIELYGNLTAALIASGRTEEAVAVFTDALERHPDSSALRFRFGTLLLQLNRFPEAVDQFQAVIAASPQAPEAHGNLGAALAASGRTEEAISEFEEALRLKPDLVSARRNLEIALQALKKKR
jgi:Flp pilus assembly protein TadD/4-amino-4-deoxy-L-arabinose transferase-like glycosyltransferase